MAKNKRKARKSNIFLTVILSITVVLIASLGGYNCYRITKYTQKNEKLIVKLQQTKEKYNKKVEKGKELSTDIEKLNNLDKEIIDTKEELFKLATELEKKILNKETNYKIAYITFDDGPYHSTDKVLEILKKYNVKATFFTIGLDKDTCYDNRNYSCKETYKKIVDNGHTIANHTYSHQIFNGLYSSANSFITQIEKQEQLIQERTGAKTNIMRFPGGNGTCHAIAGSQCNTIKARLKEKGYGWIDWTAQDGDGGYVASTDVAWKNFTGSINEDIEVVLFHDYSGITISILPSVIEYLQERNYILLPLFYDSVKVNK